MILVAWALLRLCEVSLYIWGLVSLALLLFLGWISPKSGRQDLPSVVPWAIGGDVAFPYGCFCLVQDHQNP